MNLYTAFIVVRIKYMANPNYAAPNSPSPITEPTSIAIDVCGHLCTVYLVMRWGERRLWLLSPKRRQGPWRCGFSSLGALPVAGPRRLLVAPPASAHTRQEAETRETAHGLSPRPPGALVLLWHPGIPTPALTPSPPLSRHTGSTPPHLPGPTGHDGRQPGVLETIPISSSLAC